MEGERAFSRADITNVRLPDNLVEIGASAFHNALLAGQITLPDTLERIGDSAFDQATFTGELNLPDSLTEIGNRAFYKFRFTGTFNMNSLERLGELALGESLVTTVIDNNKAVLGIDTIRLATWNYYRR